MQVMPACPCTAGLFPYHLPSSEGSGAMWVLGQMRGKKWPGQLSVAGRLCGLSTARWRAGLRAVCTAVGLGEAAQPDTSPWGLARGLRVFPCLLERVDSSGWPPHSARLADRARPRDVCHRREGEARSPRWCPGGQHSTAGKGAGGDTSPLSPGRRQPERPHTGDKSATRSYLEKARSCRGLSVAEL